MRRRHGSFLEWFLLSAFSGFCSLILGVIKHKPDITDKTASYSGGWCKHDE